VEKLSLLTDQIEKGTDAMETTLASLSTIEDITELSESIRDLLLPKMAGLRAVADEAERLTAKEYWPFPTYGDLLFSI
jgi:glutamine synthetase